jgi:glycosyltransferase involved in cell wall biosynthesis
VDQLNERGLRTTLTVVGCEPEISGGIPPYLQTKGFLSKNKANDIVAMEALLSTSHFLFVPSIAESFGAVFCEASSFGTPSISRRVGGIPSAVRDGINGQLFPSDAEPSAYCDYIIDQFRHYDRYKALAMSSFDEYLNRLNWDQTARKLIDILHKVSSK